jgi:hypothetical protein
VPTCHTSSVVCLWHALHGVVSALWALPACVCLHGIVCMCGHEGGMVQVAEGDVGSATSLPICWPVHVCDGGHSWMGAGTAGVASALCSCACMRWRPQLDGCRRCGCRLSLVFLCVRVMEATAGWVQVLRALSQPCVPVHACAVSVCCMCMHGVVYLCMCAMRGMPSPACVVHVQPHRPVGVCCIVRPQWPVHV